MPSGNGRAPHSWKKTEITANGGPMTSTAQNTKIKVINPQKTFIYELFRFSTVFVVVYTYNYVCQSMQVFFIV